MNNTKNLITSKQLMSFIVSAQIGFGLLSLPSDLSKYLGHDGWISLIISGILTILIILILMQLLKKFKNKSLFEINTMVFGKVLGFLFNIFIILHLLFLAAVGLRVFTEVLNLVILKKTPQLFTSLCILVPTLYMTSKGLKAICRYTSLLYICYIFLIGVLLIGRGHFHYTFLLPINEIGFMNIIRYTYITLFSYIGYGLVATIYHNVRDKENVTKYMIFAEIFVTIFFVIITIFITMTFGENKLKFLIVPLFSAIQALNLPIIERLDTLFILFWFPTMASSFNCFYFCSYHSLTNVFNFKNKRLTLGLFALILLVVSRIPKDFADMTYYIDATWKSDLIFIGLLFVTYILSTFKLKEVAV